MSYLDENLVQGEEVLLRARKTKFMFADTVFYILVATAFAVCFFMFDLLENQDTIIRAVIAGAPLIIAILLFLEDCISYSSLEVIVTNKRILGKQGVLGLTLLDVPLNNVTNIKVDMSLFGKMFGYGTLTILAPSGQFVYRQLADALEIQRTVNNTRLQ